jgi:hypothetical protein
MELSKVKDAFREITSALSKEMNELLLEDGISGMMKFYKNERIDGCDFMNDGDMLLYQYGVYGFSGKHEFQINITRQLIVQNEDEPLQLQLTFFYTVNHKNDGLIEKGKWCDNVENAPQYYEDIQKSKAYEIYHSERPDRVECIFEQC